MASVAGLNVTGVAIPSDMASKSTEYHVVHQQRRDSGSSQDTSVLDAMKDLDYEWSRPNTFYTQNYNTNYARLPISHQHTHPTPISPWKSFHQFQDPSQLDPVDTDLNFQQHTASALSPEFTGTSSSSATQTMSPTQIAFSYPPVEASYSSSSVSGHGGTGTSASSSHPSHFMAIGNEHPSKRHGIAIASVESDSASSPILSTRARRSSYAEPGSARAVYLEKNRHAARKCRTKQKKQQEVLVEAARDMERKNRELKAEVEFLRGDMRELMGIIFQHGSCPDQRLSRYVQREADRLGAQGSSDHSFKMESPRSPAMTSVSTPETV